MGELTGARVSSAARTVPSRRRSLGCCLRSQERSSCMQTQLKDTDAFEWHRFPHMPGMISNPLRWLICLRSFVQPLADMDPLYRWGGHAENLAARRLGVPSQQQDMPEGVFDKCISSVRACSFLFCSPL